MHRGYTYPRHTPAAYIYTPVGVTSAIVSEQGLNFRRSSCQKQSVQCRLFRNVVLPPSSSIHLSVYPSRDRQIAATKVQNLFVIRSPNKKKVAKKLLRMSKRALKDHLRRTIGIIESFQSRKIHFRKPCYPFLLG